MDATTLFSPAVLAAFGVCAIHIASWLRQIANGEDMLVVRRSVRAAPDRVWSCLMNDRHIPDIAGVTVRQFDLGGDGRRVATVLEHEEGWIYSTVDRATHIEPGRQLVRHVEEIDGQIEPFGSAQWEIVALNPTQTGTEIFMATQGHFGLPNVLWLILSLHCSARRLRRAVEAV